MIEQPSFLLWAAALKWVNRNMMLKWWQVIHDKNQEWADLRDHTIICLILLLLFSFVNVHFRLRQSLFFLMRSTQISNAVLSNMLLILRRRDRALYRYRRNCPHVWVYPRNQQCFEEISRNPEMHGFWKEHFRMNLDSFQELCRIRACTLLRSSALL